MADIRTDAAFAVRLVTAVDAEGFPAERAWEMAPPVRFCADWQGKNADPQRETEARALWTRERLDLRFIARYRRLRIYSDAESIGRREHVVEPLVWEVFLHPTATRPGCYHALV